jgi:two-component system, cell cycle response regulator
MESGSLSTAVVRLLSSPRVRRAAFGVLAAGLALHVAQLTVGVADGAFEWALTIGLNQALIFAAALVCVARVVAIREDRLAWGLVAAGIAAWGAAEVYWEVALADLAAPPYPSLADAGWLAIYPASYAAIFLLAARGRRRPTPGLWLDGAIAALGAIALFSAALFGPILESAVEGKTATVLTNLAYPTGDLLLLATIGVVYGRSGWRPDRMWILFGAGQVLSAVADSWYLAVTAGHSWDAGAILNALWPASALLMAWASWQPRRTDEAPLAGRRLVLIPTAFALTGLALLTLDHFERLNPLALILSSATLVVAVLRMGTAFRANVHMLERSRREAVTDALTGLGNRRRLMADLDAGMAAGGDEPELLVLFDLDGFKRYNDTFGHPAGDALLQRLGGKLGAAVEGRGTAYRMGGDEFCVLLHAPDGERDALVAAAAEALSEHGHGFAIGASHGCVVPRLEASTAVEALQVADHRMYRHKAGRQSGRTSDTRDVLLRVLREREPDLHEHLTHVAELARGVGLHYGLGAEALDELARAAELHDVGKMAVPDAILDKPGPLDDKEWEFMRRHTIIGEAILSAAPALVPVAKIVRASHERYDGAGYPDGVAGTEIPLGARIVAVCDAFDAMTSDRSYRRAMSAEAAVAELRAASGSQFDPGVVEAFCAVLAAAPAPVAR